MTQNYCTQGAVQPSVSVSSLRLHILVYLMFFAFAMTSDAVGVIIPHLVEHYQLSHTQVSAFHYAPMIFIAVSALLFGFLADKLGRKPVICVGLALFAVACFFFSVSEIFLMFVALLSLIGIAIGLFKTGAVGLIGDISSDSKQHTQTMNRVEGFFGIGAIVGPAIVSYLLVAGLSWKYLYLAAGILCAVLCIATFLIRFPKIKTNNKVQQEAKVSLKDTFSLFSNKFTLGFSLATALYVAVEVAIYVWMPTLFTDYQGDYIWLATYALTIFFVLRAGGRFLGAWLLHLFSWEIVLFISTLMVAACYLLSMLGGIDAAVWGLPLSGLFMSVIYPTLNSKGVSCFPRHQHSAIAGIILFFTAASAALSPLLMGFISDSFGHIQYGFYLATGLAILLSLMCGVNLLKKPATKVLAELGEQ